MKKRTKAKVLLRVRKLFRGMGSTTCRKKKRIKSPQKAKATS